MNRIITISGARGGQGASTVAAALAVLAAGHYRTTLVSDEPDVAAALLGIARPIHGEAVEVTPGLMLAEVPVARTEVTVVDISPAATPFPHQPEGEHYAVLRGPCYLALASVVAAPEAPQGIILVAEAGRSLTARDVTEVTGLPVVATVRASQGVARTIDAGLLLARLHHLRELNELRTLIPVPRAAATRSAAPSVSDATPATACQPAPPSPNEHTDLPCPLSGHGVEGRTRCQNPPWTRRDVGASKHVVGMWPNRRRWRRTPDVEHRQAGSRRRRLLHR